ncbi:MAG: argininosuccinate synthase [Actinomycetota bacterium]
MPDQVVLAYSGGLDTTVAVRWLIENLSVDVVAVVVDVGQGGDIAGITDRALASGAIEAFVIDASDEFAKEFVSRALATNARYQGKYPLVSALSRPLIVRHLARVAREKGARYIAHGCTGKGNDQVRFEVGLAALAPEVEVLAPVREWGLSRDESIAYGLERGLPAPVGPASPYSIDENMWGRAIECGVLEDPMTEPPEDIWALTRPIASAPREPSYAEVEFHKGTPLVVDGAELPLAGVVEKIGSLAGRYGFGRMDMIEDRVVGIKSREVYEAPAALALIAAHSDLEEMTLDREVLRVKRSLEQKYAELVYEGLWFSPLREAIDAFVQSTEQWVTGTVRLRFDPGSVRVVGRSSPNSLYDTALASYTKQDSFDHVASAGFVKLWGLPSKIWGMTRNRSS